MHIERTTPYPEGLYPEQLPSWLTWVTTWAGRSVPDTRQPFRYVDLGCGVGLTACWVKRCYPHAEVVGVDLDPKHIDASRALAEQLSVDVTFVHGPFDAVEAPADFVVAHGVWSWIGPDTRAGLVELLGRLVAPGGLFYVDYNALPGRSDWVVLSGLLRTLAPQLAEGDAIALGKALDVVETLAGTGFFARRPGVADGLRDALTRQPGYLVHEFLSEGWAAFFLADVARELGPAGLSYATTTHLWEAVEGFRTTEAERQTLRACQDLVVRHTLRDTLRDTAFRHDVFQRGGRRLTQTERLDALLDRTYALGRAPEACPLDGLPAGCGELLAALDGPPRTGRELVHDRDPHAVAAHLGLLCAAGFVFPGDHALLPVDVDDLMAWDVDLLPVMSPSGLEVTFTRTDRALWRAWDDDDVVGSALARLAAEGHRLPTRDEGEAAQRQAMAAQLDAFRAAIPDLVRAGWVDLA